MSLKIIQLPDAPQSFALIRRTHDRTIVLSRWPTKNSAFDAHYAEAHSRAPARWPRKS